MSAPSANRTPVTHPTDVETSTTSEPKRVRSPSEVAAAPRTRPSAARPPRRRRARMRLRPRPRGTPAVRWRRSPRERRSSCHSTPEAELDVAPAGRESVLGHQEQVAESDVTRTPHADLFLPVLEHLEAAVRQADRDLVRVVTPNLLEAATGHPRGGAPAVDQDHSTGPAAHELERDAGTEDPRAHDHDVCGVQDNRSRADARRLAPAALSPCGGPRPRGTDIVPGRDGDRHEAS